MTTAEVPTRYTLVRPSLLTSEDAAAAAVTASAFPPPPLPQHRANHQADGSSSYYLSPRTITALEDFEKQSRDPNVLYGRDVIQVPLKVEDRNEYVNLVLSHREFDMMAVHIPQYDEMQPVELLEEITKILKEEEKNRKMKQGIAAAAGADAADSVSIFQARILELEFEMKRLNTKLAAARSLQSSITDENTALRMNVRELEKTSVEYEKLYMQNELLREQAVLAATEVARMKKIAADAQLQVAQFNTELQRLRTQVYQERESLNQTAKEMLNTFAQDVRKREQILQESYLEEKAERQLMAEKYYELSGRIRVFCRMRPPMRGDSVALLRPKPNSVLVERGAKEFSFDHVFGPESTQTDVFAKVEPLVTSFTDGYNSCIMAYGQTGTGKTFTMVGNRDMKELEGVIPRALQQVFAVVNARQLTYKDTLRVSMIEIYNDQILDLLNEDSGRSGKGAVVKNENDITARSVTLWPQVDAVLAEGNANRNIAATSMNLESSRSHALVYLHLESQHRETLETKTSTLCLVDLAGSERISRSQVEGERLKETQHINKSLSALGDVVYALQHKAKHTPYRNSKLTYMLRDMLSGQAKTLLMLQLSPDDADVEETTCSLQFGARVSQVSMGAVRQSVESGEIFKLKDENRALATKLKSYEDKVAEWKDEN
uniref:Kinesin-like protein n=1 Tax=Globisporangium ultimum (strain ATCC 200006 / CBS 805.95 / DAOM BR144) TaxID=431595 RepID=K3WGY6_GLOUD